MKSLFAPAVRLMNSLKQVLISGFAHGFAVDLGDDAKSGEDKLQDSASEGLRRAKELHPGVITLDVMMPGKDGWEVLSALKADPNTADIPMIILTMTNDKTSTIRLALRIT